MTNTHTLNKDECDHEVYAHGEVIGVFDMPKDKANELVVKLSKKTGNRIDWHYVGGRVVMKMLPPKASVNSRTLKSRNQREGKRTKVKQVRVLELNGVNLIEFFYVLKRKKDHE